LIEGIGGNSRDENDTIRQKGDQAVEIVFAKQRWQAIF
jgi:hypothetical protein